MIDIVNRTYFGLNGKFVFFRLCQQAVDENLHPVEHVTAVIIITGSGNDAEGLHIVPTFLF
jgi:hypothetical protein